MFSCLLRLLRRLLRPSASEREMSPGLSPLCACKDRYHAMCCGEFLWSEIVGGWMFVDAPVRTMSWRTRYLANERGHIPDDHTGEPYRWYDCPWCGRELPQRIKPEILLDEDGN